MSRAHSFFFLLFFPSCKYTHCCNAQDNHSCKLWLVYHHSGSVPLHCFSQRTERQRCCFSTKNYKRNSFGSAGYCLDVSFSQLWCLMLFQGLLFLLNYSWDETRSSSLFPHPRDEATQTAASWWPCIHIMPYGHTSICQYTADLYLLRVGRGYNCCL